MSKPQFDVSIYIGIPNRKKNSRASSKWTASIPILIVMTLLYMLSRRLDHMGVLEWAGTGLIVVLTVLMGIIHYREYQLSLELEQLSGIAEIDRMSSTEFEEVIATYFEKIGFEVENNPKRGSRGADLIMTKDGQKVVVQTKRYKNKVGVAAIDEVLISQSDYDAEKALVVTNNTFTKPARQLAAAHHTILWDRQVLIEKLAAQARLEMKE